MDKILEMAKDLGYTIQEDKRFLDVFTAQQTADKDEELQSLIGDFNLKRMAINTETSKEDGEKDDDKLRELNTELRALYAEIMSNENMKAFEAAKTELDRLSRAVMTIINMSVQGMDPNTYEESADCTGNCSTCGGCH